MSDELEVAKQWGTTSDLDQLVEEFVAFFETFGVRSTVARVWAVLYLAPTPLGQDELRSLTGLSAGMVSHALRELHVWEAVQVQKVDGSRRRHYEARTEILPVLRHILRQRDVRVVQRLRDVIARARTSYQPPGARERITKRLDAVDQTARLFEAFAGLVEGMGRWPGIAPLVEAALRRLARRPAQDPSP